MSPTEAGIRAAAEPGSVSHFEGVQVPQHNDIATNEAGRPGTPSLEQKGKSEPTLDGDALDTRR
jgi:hypothetical protein